MKLGARTLLLWGSITLPRALAQTTDRQVASYWETTAGTCAYYWRKPAKKTVLSQTCIKYCELHDGHGYSECDHMAYKDIDIEKKFDKSLIGQDEDGDFWVPTKCKCSNPDVEKFALMIFDIVAEALEKLDNIICAVMLEAFKTIIDVGIMFVPGGQAVGAMRAVQGAKSFYENGMEAADFFGNWVGKACGVPDWNFDLWGSLIGAPDTIGTSVGCKRKNKSECKTPPKNTDKPTSKKEATSTTKKETSTSTPTSTLTSTLTSTPTGTPTSTPTSSETATPTTSETTTPTSTPTTTETTTPTTTTTDGTSATSTHSTSTTSTDSTSTTSTDSTSATSTDSTSATSTDSTSTTPTDSTSATSTDSTSTTSTDSASATSTDSTSTTPTDSTSATSTDSTSTTSTDSTSTTPTDSTSTTPTDTASTSTTTSTSSESCGGPSGTKRDAAPACEATTPCNNPKPDTGDDGLDDSEEDVTDLLIRNGRRSFRRSMLEKRGRKTSNPCKATSNSDFPKNWKLSSDPYPENGKLDANVPAYGWVKQNDYCDYSWQSGVKKTSNGNYDSEHVMEWQIITEFFAHLQEKGGANFDHPDPNQNKTVDFCTYWVESWKLEAGQEFSIASSKPLSPFQHIAAAYPSTKNFKEEFVALQRNINSQAKALLFTGDTEWVWGKDDMDKYAKAKDKVGADRYKVLERLRQAIGAQKYLGEKEIKDTFKKQKERMGKMLDDLDNDMASHPRVVVSPQGAVVTYTPWKKQNLLTEWNTFLDNKWDTAAARNKKILERWTDALYTAHCKNRAALKRQADKDFCSRLIELEKQAAAAPAFSKPW